MSMMIQPYRFGPAGDDPHWANVVLLCHFDGTDGSTSFVDQTGKVMTAVGNAQIDTAQSKFGGSSGLFDGTGDRVTVADSEDWNFSNKAFTIEFFVRLNSKQYPQCFLSQGEGSGTGATFAFYTSSGELRLRTAYGASYIQSGVAWAPTLGQWYHICMERDGTGKLRVYVDGVMLFGNNDHAYTYNNSSFPLALGAFGTENNFPTYDFNGWMDELRITKGVARYASDGGFTVTTTAYPNS